MAHVLPDNNPGATLGKPAKHNQRRILLLGLAGAAGLALFLARGSGGASAPAPPAGTVDPTTTAADNGGQAAALGNSVTGALGDVGTQLSGLTDAVGALAAQQQTAQAAPVDPSGLTAPDIVAAVSTGVSQGLAAGLQPAATKGSPSGAKARKAASPRPPYKTVVLHGYVRHVYTDRRGHVTRDVAVRRAPAPRKRTPAKRGRRR
jgi:hypothetical protein